MSQTLGADVDEELLNRLFGALRDPVRRRLLFDLLEHNPRDPFLVPEDVDAGERDLEQLHIALVHQHLPMLEDAGFIRWDRENDEVHMCPEFTGVGNILRAIKEEEAACRTV